MQYIVAVLCTAAPFSRIFSLRHSTQSTSSEPSIRFRSSSFITKRFFSISTDSRGKNMNVVLHSGQCPLSFPWPLSRYQSSRQLEQYAWKHGRTSGSVSSCSHSGHVVISSGCFTVATAMFLTHARKTQRRSHTRWGSLQLDPRPSSWN